MPTPLSGSAPNGNKNTLTITQGDTVNNPNALTITNSGTGAGIKLTQNGNTSASTSVGGSINLTNTNNTGAGIVAYTNQASPSGHLVALRADNATFNQAALYVDYRGDSNAVAIINTGTGSSNGALNITSSNTDESTLKLAGNELAKGTIKVTHTGTGADTTAAGLSINLAGTSTAAQGIFVDSTTGTTGDLMKLRNAGVSKFTVSKDGNISIAGTTLLSANPTLALQAATKQYVDGVAQGLSVKASVQEATAAALPTNTYLAGVITITATGTLTVDGQLVALNDRVLVKNEVAGANNGIYLCTTAGAVGVAAVLTRATDSDTGAKILGGFVFVELGTANAAAGFVNTNATAPTIGTTAITYTQFSGAGEITASTGLTKTGNTLTIDTSITVDKTTVQTLTNKTLTSPAITTPTGIVKGDVGLGNVDNTSDATKNAASVTLTNKTLTGGLVTADPSVALGIASKQYVDNLDPSMFPSDHTLKTWSYDPIAAVNNSLPTVGTAYVVKVKIPVSTTLSNLYYTVGTAGNTVSNAYIALYQSGTLLAQSADIGSTLASTGNKTATITPTSVAAGYAQIVFWVGAATTAPALARGASSAGMNIGLTSTGLRYSTADTGLTTTGPSSLGSQTTSNIAFWVGAS